VGRGAAAPSFVRPCPAGSGAGGVDVANSCSRDAELARSLSITVENCSADADVAASLQERPREDCSCDEQLARVLAGVSIASSESVSTSKLVRWADWMSRRRYGR
jgi:hypothetical protein